MAKTTEKVLQARIKLVDNFTKPMQKARQETEKYSKASKKVSPLMLKAKDMATKVIKMVSAKAKAFGKGVYSATVKVKDMATSAIGSIQSKLTALAAGATIMVGLKTGLDGLASEQNQKITIDRVIQNSGVDKAKSGAMTEDYYGFLTEFANSTPFETSAVAQFGTKAMMMSKGNVDQAKNITKTMGNVKAFVGDLRTETEVAEAFFSASNGNMDMLNNMLGEQYQTMDEAMAGIQKKQGGLTEAMSGTVGGLTSTIVGKTKDAMKNFVKVFEEPIKNAQGKIISFVDSASVKLVEFGGKLSQSFAVFSKSEEAAALMQIFGSVCSTVWGMIQSVVAACTPVVQAIMGYMRDNADVISGAIQGLGNAWNGLCQILGPVLEVAWAVVEPILSFFFGILRDLGNMIKSIGDWWTDMCNKIKNNPIVAKVTTFMDGASSRGNSVISPKDMQKNAFGSGRIARNGELHELHQGEKVLTKQQASQYEKGNGNGVNISVANLTVREEADVNKIAKQLVRELKKAQFAYGGGY